MLIPNYRKWGKSDVPLIDGHPTIICPAETTIVANELIPIIEQHNFHPDIKVEGNLIIFVGYANIRNWHVSDTKRFRTLMLAIYTHLGISYLEC